MAQVVAKDEVERGNSKVRNPDLAIFTFYFLLCHGSAFAVCIFRRVLAFLAALAVLSSASVVRRLAFALRSS